MPYYAFCLARLARCPLALCPRTKTLISQNPTETCAPSEDFLPQRGCLRFFEAFEPCRYAVSTWHDLAKKCRRLGGSRCMLGFILRPISYLFAFLGSASPRPPIKNYLAPDRMRVRARTASHTEPPKVPLCSIIGHLDTQGA